MSPASCPRPEEFSALIDRELAPEVIPELERHVGECRLCRALFLRLSAADRTFSLVVPKTDLVRECVKVRPGDGDAPGDQLIDDLSAMGRAECVRSVKESQRLGRQRRRRFGLGVLVVLLGLCGGFFAVVQPSPVVSMGGAKRKGVHVIGGKGGSEVVLHRGIKVKLFEDTRVRFYCAFRWDRPNVELVSGRLEVIQGKLLVRDGMERIELVSGGTASLGPDGKLETTAGRSWKRPKIELEPETAPPKTN
ncbi:MAG: hypothetical protein ACYTGB_02895 [Planctomycetota bacterium]